MRLVRTFATVVSVALIGAAIGVTGVSAAVAAPVYRVDAVVPDGVATAINEAGDFVGWQTVDGSTRAFVYRAGAETLLPTPEDKPLSVARDINDNGTVVGSAYDAVIHEPGDAFRWTPGTSGWTATDLGVLPNDLASEATGMNDGESIVGHSNKRSALDHENAFLYTSANGLTPLVAGTSFVPQDINEHGMAAGNGWSSAGLLNTKTNSLASLPASDASHISFAYALNDNGQVAGAISSTSGNAQVVARYSAATGWQSLGGLGGGSTQNIGWGINNVGTVVGTGWARTGTQVPQRGVIYLDSIGSLKYVDDLQETGSEWSVYAAYDINDAGQIVGRARNTTTSQSAAVRLSPVTPAVTRDTTSPTVQIMSPAAGGTVSGLVRVKANSSDNVAVTQVKLKVGTKLIGTCSAVAPSSYSCRWDTRNGKNGLKTLHVIALDAAGNKTTTSRTVTIKNTR
jgi:probable HAF family extracellular repeat protein